MVLGKRRKKNKKNKQKQSILSEAAIVVSNALSEDIGAGDITSQGLIDPQTKVKAWIIVKEKNIVVCGMDILKEVFYQVDRKIKIKSYVRDGDFLKTKTKICEIQGAARSILTAERTALNFLGRFSGISTKTYLLVKKIKKYKIKILDTRKTTPGLRILEKYAVKIGGGINHRMGLYDCVLIKDNHLKLLRQQKKEDIFKSAINRFKKKFKGRIKIEVEVKNQKELKNALKCNPDVIMLDNMSLTQMRQAVKMRDLLNSQVRLEASGNINEANIEQAAASGVDFISVGALTHSVKSIDFSLNFIDF
ncbi:MAG: carboxylating nicotinate-nucleotide diphosphorylase [Candidatus Omnitrophota bacterium]